MTTQTSLIKIDKRSMFKDPARLLIVPSKMKYKLDPKIKLVIERIVERMRHWMLIPNVREIFSSRDSFMHYMVDILESCLQHISWDYANVLYSTNKASRRDAYNNPVRYGTFDMHSWHVSSKNTKQSVDATGRFVVEIVPVMEHRLFASRLKRLFSRWFPKLISTGNNKFQTSFVVKLRFWLDQDVAYEIPVCSIPVADRIVPPIYKTKHTRTFEDNAKRRFLESQFRSLGRIRFS